MFKNLQSLLIFSRLSSVKKMLNDEKEVQQFSEYFKGADFIQGFSVFPFTFSPFRLKIANSVLFFKGK